MNKMLVSCPVHAPADPSSVDAWACPAGCEYLEAELDRRILDITVSGQFFKLVPGRRSKGRFLFQEYRGFKPFGSPKPHGAPVVRESLLRRLREMYRARRR